MKVKQVPAAESLPPILSTKQCAEYGNVHVKTIYRLIEEGTLPAVRFGPRCMRIRREDLLALLTPASEGSHHAARKKN
jgi:excisionase family DNA binding protein